MAVTLNSTGITFSNGTSQATEATLLGAVQYTSYSGVNLTGYQTYQTGVAESFFFNSNNMTNVPASSSSVVCGFQAYRSGNASTGNDGTQDAGTIQRRMAYRSVGLA